jgi:serine/threonine-protein phosphatase 4 regulatory subunit 4
MDYRSPFEIKQSILEEVQSLTQSAAHPNTTKRPKKAGAATSSGSADPTLIEKEMPGIENMNALNANMKMEEDVQRHIESGQLQSYEVPLYIMNNGSTTQKISMFQHLHKTIKDFEGKKLTALINGLAESMFVQAPELQCAAPAGLIEVLPLMSTDHIVEMFVGYRTMLEVSALEVRQSWVPFMLECCRYLDAKLLLDKVVPLSIKKCEHSEQPDQRVFACTLMGHMCRRLSAEQVIASILNKALAMCQDTNIAVRCEMCTQLGEVARAIGLENAKARVTAELFELLSDEERLVSRAAFSCLIDLIELFDAPYRREHFFPIIKSYISSPPEEVLSLLIEEFGRFLWKIRSDIQSHEDITLFATFFRQSSQKSDAEVRRMCAFNLPAVVASLPISAYTSHIHHCTKALSTDSHTPVRRAVAGGFHELVTLLGDKAAALLCDTFAVIAQDPSIEVRTMLMKNAPLVLQTFSSQLRSEKERDAFFLSLVPALLSFDQQCPKDWRKSIMLLDVLSKSHEYYNGQVLFEKFVPPLLRHLSESANIIKDQCAELIMTFTASMRVSSNAVEVFHKLYHEFGRSTSCYQRLNYVRLFSCACEQFSRKFLKERMLDLILELSRDQVTSIRIAVARVAPKIRRVLKSVSQPNEQTQLDNFLNALQRLQMDDDELVREAARESSDIIEQIERDYNRQQLMRSAPTSTEDVVDKKREETEGNLIEAAKDFDKAERRSKLKELLKSEKEKEETTGPRKPGAHVPTKRTSNLATGPNKPHSSNSLLGSAGKEATTPTGSATHRPVTKLSSTAATRETGPTPTVRLTKR